MLTTEERKARGRIAASTRWGTDTEPDRRAFLRLQSRRQLDEVAARLVDARSEQGLPDRVTDAAALARIAGLLLAEPEAKATP